MSRHHRSPPNSAAAASEVESVRRPGRAKRAAGCRRSGYSCWWRSRRKAEGHPPRPPSLFRRRRADRLRLRNGATPARRLRWFGVRWRTGRFQAERRHFVSSIPHLEEDVVSLPYLAAGGSSSVGDGNSASATSATCPLLPRPLAAFVEGIARIPSAVSSCRSDRRLSCIASFCHR